MTRLARCITVVVVLAPVLLVSPPLFAHVGIAPPAPAMTEEHAPGVDALGPLLESSWRALGDHGVCRLERRLPGVGMARISRVARESDRFDLLTRGVVFEAGDAQLIAETPTWHRRYSEDDRVARVRIARDAVGLSMGGRLVEAMIAALRQGLLMRISPDASPTPGIAISGVGFASAYEQYLDCSAQPPKPKPRVAHAAAPPQVAVHFALNEAIVEPEDVARLNDFVSRTQLDKLHSNVVIDAHTDSSGTLERNEALSRARAEATAQIVSAKGVAPERMTLHFHADRTPASSNSTLRGRAQNRRATVRLLTTMATRVATTTTKATTVAAPGADKAISAAPARSPAAAATSAGL